MGRVGDGKRCKRKRFLFGLTEPELASRSLRVVWARTRTNKSFILVDVCFLRLLRGRGNAVWSLRIRGIME